MLDQDKSKQQLLEEVTEVRHRVALLESAESQRQRSEERYRLLTEAIPQVLWRADANRQTVECNRRWYEYTGQTPEEARGLGWLRMLHPDDVARVAEQVQEAQAAGEPYQAEYRMRRASDGSYRWHLSRALPMKDEEGKITGWFGSVTDIDDHKRAQEALREERNRAQQYLDVAAVIMVALDDEGKITLLNQKGYEILGYSAGTLLGRNWFGTCVPKRLREKVLAAFRQLMAGHLEPVEFYENPVVTCSAEERIIAWHNALLIDEAGQIVGTLSSGTDVTDRKRADEALKKAHDELEQRVQERTAELAKANENLDIFRRFAEAAGEGFGMSDFDGRIAYVNPTLCRLFGEEKPEDVIGQSVFTYYQKEYVQRRQNELIPTLLREGRWHIEQTVLPRRGKPVSTLQSTFLIRDESGNPFRIAVVISDITERKRAQESLRQSYDELRAIYDQMVEGILVVDAETMNPVRANTAFCRMLGYSEEDVMTISPERIHPPEVLPAVWEHLEAVKKGSIARTENLPFLRRDGSLVYADVVSSRICYDQRPAWISFFHDVTERKQAHEALQRQHQTLKHLLQSSDHERQLIAYEIHDGLAQQLAAAIMQFQAYDHLKAAKPKHAANAYHAGMTMLRQSHYEARRLISGVRPPILDEEGIVAAVAHLVNEERGKKGPQILFQAKVAFDRLTPILENAVYRIAQEALTNACKHSKAKKVCVELVQCGDRIRIEVQDRGVGFKPEDVGESRFGLEGIRERARLLGGTATVTSEPGQGTRIVVELPIVLRRPEDEQPAESEE